MMTLTPTANPHSATLPVDVGCVVIGRNEGERLERCLRSVRPQVAHMVYVDSRSSDGSVALARRMGAMVVELTAEGPVTAAAARAAGFAALRRAHPTCEFVQFVDGDTELASDWVARGAAHLRAHPEVGVTAGRQRERDPALGAFHRLFDLEWDTSRGFVRYCAGNAMVRASAYEAAGGYRPDLIAGEEPELCVRIRRRGHQVEALEVPMAVHDAGKVGFRQWWRRSVRAGHAFAQGASLHGARPERHYVRETRRIVFWAGVFPLAVSALAVWLGAWALGLLPLGYLVTAGRVYRHVRRRGRSAHDARLAACFYTLGKFAEFWGVLRFWWGRLLGRRSTIIEYKRS